MAVDPADLAAAARVSFPAAPSRIFGGTAAALTGEAGLIAPASGPGLIVHDGAVTTDGSFAGAGPAAGAGGTTIAGTADSSGPACRSVPLAAGPHCPGGSLLPIPLAAAPLLWPALWNGYPIVFADTGTYLSQAIHHFAGWDRPVFYSLFMLPLHATVSVWPVVVTQALMASYVLQLVCRMLVPALPATCFVAGIAVLSLTTWLPWLVSELMPDVFTPLLVLLTGVLAWTPERISRRQQVCLMVLAAFMIASQQSSVPLYGILLTGLTVLRWGRRAPSEAVNRAAEPALSRHILRTVLPVALAVLGLCTVNMLAYGRIAISPFGNVFLLARVIYDGPGMATLRRDCPARHWRLCPFVEQFPATSDAFLWTANSPLYLAGGPKAVSQDAGAIIHAAWQSDPSGVVGAAAANALEQLIRFSSGDGLQPWPQEVTPSIRHDFPAAEFARYTAARQQQGRLSVPAALAWTHKIVSLLGVAACVMLLPVAVKRGDLSLGFLFVVLLALPVGAAITGGLSAPHDRYQSRLMWLPPFVAVLSARSLCFPSGSPSAWPVSPGRFVASRRSARSRR